METLLFFQVLLLLAVEAEELGEVAAELEALVLEAEEHMALEAEEVTILAQRSTVVMVEV